MEDTSGIVRRVDELGRVVIPKEMRRTLRIKEGEEMEVTVQNNSQIVLKKYSAIKQLSEFEQEFVDSIYEITGNNALICDNDNIVVCATDKGVYSLKQISKQVETVLGNRKSVYLYGIDMIPIINEKETYKDLVIAPIIYKGDIIGGVIIISTKGMNENSLKLAEVAANFLAKQI